jgi:hypothetical protein
MVRRKAVAWLQQVEVLVGCSVSKRAVRFPVMGPEQWRMLCLGAAVAASASRRVYQVCKEHQCCVYGGPCDSAPSACRTVNSMSAAWQVVRLLCSFPAVDSVPIMCRPAMLVVIRIPVSVRNGCEQPVSGFTLCHGDSRCAPLWNV